MPIIGISSAIGLISFSISKSTTSVHFNGKTTTLKKKLAIKFVNVLDQYIILCGQPLYFSTTALCFEVIKFRYSEKATKFAFWVSIFFFVLLTIQYLAAQRRKSVHEKNQLTETNLALVTTKQSVDFSKFCGLLRISELYPA